MPALMKGVKLLFLLVKFIPDSARAIDFYLHLLSSIKSFFAFLEDALTASIDI